MMRPFTYRGYTISERYDRAYEVWRRGVHFGIFESPWDAKQAILALI